MSKADAPEWYRTALSKVTSVQSLEVLDKALYWIQLCEFPEPVVFLCPECWEFKWLKCCAYLCFDGTPSFLIAHNGTKFAQASFPEFYACIAKYNSSEPPSTQEPKTEQLI